jgi:hypothetical protein
MGDGTLDSDAAVGQDAYGRFACIGAIHKSVWPIHAVSQ